MENKKISMFTRMYSAITDFRIYPFIQKEKLRTAIGYFLKLFLLISLVFSIYFTIGIHETMSQVSKDYNTKIPNFVLENGVFTADKALYSTGNEMIVFDTEHKAIELEEIYRKQLIGYNSYALVGKDAIDIYSNGNFAYAIAFEGFVGTLTKDFFYNNIFAHVDSIIFNISLFIMVYISVLIVNIQFKLMSLLMAISLMYILNIVFRIIFKFSDALKISIYTLTLPMIVEVIAFIVVGKISESTAYIYQILLSLYVFYALRAIKLDKMIIEATKNGILKRVVKSDSTEENVGFVVKSTPKEDNEKENNDENKED